MKKLFTLLLLFAVLQAATAQILVNEGFEEGNADGLPPVGWICDDGGWKCGFQEQDHNRIPHNGEWYVYSSYNMDKWMYKEIQVTAGEYYRVSFWHVTNGYDEFTFEVKAGTSPNPSAMSIAIVPEMIINNEEYDITSGVFQSSMTGTLYVGFHSVADISPWYLTIDDIIIEKTDLYNFVVETFTPDTSIYVGEPGSFRFRVTNTGSEEETVSFNNIEGNLLSAIFYVNGNAVTTANIPVSQYTDVVAVSTLPLEGISGGDEISLDFVVASVNAQHEEDVQFMINVLDPVSDYPFEEGFELETFPPFGWQTKAITGSYSFERLTSGEQPTATPHDGSLGMACYKSFYSAADNTAILVTPKLSLSAADNIVRFWMYRTNNIDNKADKINVWFNDTPDTETAVLLGTIHRVITMEPVEDHNDWFEYAFMFDSDYDYGFIVFEAVSAYGWNMYVDDVYINTTTVDENPPVIVSLSGNHTYADTDMELELCVRDESDMPATMEAVYTINGESYDLTLTSTNKSSKGDHYYTATIEGYENHTVGNIIFYLSDVLGNSTVSDAYQISWHWQAPLLKEGFEDEEFPPAGWSREGMPQTWMQWARWGVIYYEDSDEVEYIVTPPEGAKQACLEWDFQENAQDEHLMTPIITITRPTVLKFETFAHYGQVWNDHFCVRVFNTSDATWTVLWDAANLPFGMNQYEETVSIDLSQFIGNNIKIGWRGYNTDGTNLWYSWFIDDVVVIHTDTLDAPLPTFQMAQLSPDTIIDMGDCGNLRFSLINTGTVDDMLELNQITGELTGTFYINGQQANSVNLPAGTTISGYYHICVPETGYQNQQVDDIEIKATSSISGNMASVNYAVTINDPIGLAEDYTSVKLFPNPTRGLVKVETSQQIKMVQIYNANSVMVNVLTPCTKEFDIDMSANSKGLYFVRLITDSSVILRKVVLL